jgi:membrane dipeptidase
LAQSTPRAVHPARPTRRRRTGSSHGASAVGFDIEGANAIGDQINLIELYYDLGVRWMLLAYNRNNRAGGGCQDDDSGLTEFGRLVIREMERVGMQVCVSHTGHRTVRDVFNIATKPVIFSHSNPSALYVHPRNIPDDLIEACAASGGVVGVNGVGIFLGKNDSTSATYARHVDHIVQLVGPRHAALALDYVFDMQQVEEHLSRMQQTFPPGLGYELAARFVAPEQLEEIVATLQGWGYQENDLTAILGGNWLRLAREAWKRPELTKSAT